MPLPDPLPADPDELEALYRDYIEQGEFDQQEFDRLMEARLRAWGYDPTKLTADQVMSFMAESVNRMMINLYGAIESAPDGESTEQVQAIVKQAEELRTQIFKMIGESDQETPPST